MPNNNDAIIARIKGIPSQAGTPESDADPRNPNVTERQAAIEQCAQIAESMTDTADGSGEIYIARKIADKIRTLNALSHERGSAVSSQQGSTP